MTFVKPIPFQEAIDKLGSQSILGTTWSSAEMGDLPLELRENAFFSSRVESAQFLQRAQDALGNFLDGSRVNSPNGPMLATGSRAAFVDQMQTFLAKNGVLRTTGGLTDIAAEKRLGLIFDIKTRQAQDFGFWKQGMDADVLDEFPASRFIRVRDVKEPRELHERFQDQVYLKTDPIWWLEINQFGVPWGPFAFGCGHDVEDVDRDEAEELGLIKAGQTLDTAPLKKFLNLNHNLQASTKSLAPELVDKLLKEFGDKIRFEKDTLKWKGKDYERTGDSTAERVNEPPQIDAGRIGAAGQEVFGSVRTPDTGEPLDPADALAGGAHIAAVAEGRKALYHEQWGPELGAPLADQLKVLKLPNVHIFLTDDGHLLAYQPDAVRQIVDANPENYPGKSLFDKVLNATLAGTNGDLLGYGARTMLEPDRVLVQIMDGDTPVCGFFSRAAVADQFAAQRTLDFDRAYGRSFSYRIIPGLTQ